MFAVDIGNTTIHIAHFKKGRILKTQRLHTAKVTKTWLRKTLSSKTNETILVCSVVPKVTKIFRKLNLPVGVTGENIRVPVKSLYANKKVGMDRLVGAYAAKKLFPGTRLILDFGTAITLDCLSKNGVYQGGLILPGIGSTLNVLAGCAMLPKRIQLRPARQLIPATTTGSITKGVTEGFSLMINSLIAKYKTKLKIPAKAKVIITGGDARIITSNLKFPFKY